VEQVPVLLLLWILALLGDNPMQSEFACHIGLRGKLFCRACFVKGKSAPAQSKKSSVGQDATDASSNEGAASSDDGQDTEASDAGSSNAASEVQAPAKKGRKKALEPLTAMVTRLNDFIKVCSRQSLGDYRHYIVYAAWYDAKQSRHHDETTISIHGVTDCRLDHCREEETYGIWAER
jgi:hypothetical protein